MNRLNRTNSGIWIPDQEIKVLQFGGGRFQRGFTNWIIQKLNEEAQFGANCILVKPTRGGNYEKLREQDGLYHVVLSENKNGKTVFQNKLIPNIEQIIHPYNEWGAFLRTAHIPQIRFIISNTTEAGLTASPSQITTDKCPDSYPAKLTIWLYQRYVHFGGDASRGCYILPLELIADNGAILKAQVHQMALKLYNDANFTSWLDQANVFCSTLVDRIVSGYPDQDADDILDIIGLEDKLLVHGEHYHSWVIQGPETLISEFGLDHTSLNIKIVEDLGPFYSIKVRILNGMHTALVGLGCSPVINMSMRLLVMKGFFPF